MIFLSNAFLKNLVLTYVTMKAWKCCVIITKISSLCISYVCTFLYSEVHSFITNYVRFIITFLTSLYKATKSRLNNLAADISQSVHLVFWTLSISDTPNIA
jgi:hypothetical protein